MSEEDKDVALRVVSPSLSLRHSPPSSLQLSELSVTPSVYEQASPPNEPSCYFQREITAQSIEKQNKNEKLKSLVETSTNILDAAYSHLTIPHTDDDCISEHISSDDTIQNSASDHHVDTSFDESYKDCQIPDSENQKEIVKSESETMGNQSGKKKAGSDEDTPDESKTKCCEIPKKKLKDRNSKISKSSRSEENDFEDDEVYPFDSRTKTSSEQEDRDTVELEPFEIIETDDIKFIAGAGTSDVIRNASESKFKTIPEEVTADEEEELRRFEEDEETVLKEVTVPVDRGDRFLESGTSTAHSTFEFRQVKAKGKLKALREESQTVYENVDMPPGDDSDKPQKPQLSRETSYSSGSSKSSSSSNSKSSSRKSSKDPIPKPARKGKIKESVVKYENTEIQDDKSNKIKDTKEKQSKKQSNAVILTQTMFSNPKSACVKTDAQTAPIETQTQYENVNLCAIMTPTGIVIGHKKSDPAVKAGNVINAAEAPKGDDSSITSVKHASLKSDETSSVSTNNIQNSQVEAAIYETLNSDKTQRADDQKTDVKNNTESSEQELHDTNAGDISKANTSNVLQVEEDKCVPPPSPQTMDILEEEDEDEMDEEDEVTDYEETEDIDPVTRRKKSDIADFTENVCKRLSQLLEAMPQEFELSEEVPVIKTETDNHTFHIYEEVVDVRRDIASSKNNTKEIETPEMVLSVTSLNPNDSLKRNDSASTLKRTSGDSNTYPLTEFLGSSDDDLPEYFDPRSLEKEKIRPSVSKISEHAPVETGNANNQKPITRDDYVDMTVGLQEHIIQPNKPPQTLQTSNFSEPNKDFIASSVTELQDITPTAEATQELSALPEYAKLEDETSLQYQTGTHSIAYTESDLDISEHRDDLSTDSMLADDEDEETMEILFTKTYTEPEEGGEVFLSCTVVNSAYKEEKKSETWLSDDALQYLEANASDVMSTAFMKAKKEMKDIQICIQNLRHQMEHFHGDCDDVSLPDMSVGYLSPDYFPRKAVTD